MFNPNDREQRILKRIQGIKKPTKVIVRKPKKGLSKDEKEILKIINGKGKPSERLSKVLKRLK